MKVKDIAPLCTGSCLSHSSEHILCYIVSLTVPHSYTYNAEVCKYIPRVEVTLLLPFFPLVYTNKVKCRSMVL